MDFDSILFGQDAQPLTIRDELGELTKTHFQKFLEDFSPSHYTANDDDDEVDADQILAVPEYLKKIEEMMANDTTTLYCDFNHLLLYDQTLAEAIELNFYRLDKYLRKAVQNVVRNHDKTKNYITDEKGNDKEFWISFYNYNAIFKIRDLKTNKIGRLCSIRATVTRTSEVRPELLYGTFQCLDCRVQAPNIEQQFRYTEPLICKNPSCGNKIRWQLSLENSKFVDWQKVRVQENSGEIPSGSMPRTLDIILRHEEVDKAKAGDKCLFTGTLIVVPDMTGSRAPGPKIDGNSRAGFKNKGAGQSAESRELDLTKDYNYKLCFLASYVQPSDAKFGVLGNDDDEVEQEEFTEEEKEEIEVMKNTPKIYEHLIHSIAPAVYGHNDVKKGILLMLFGGVHKVTEEGINLRGDINVCIIGDPSTSKSQFLKYVVGFLPRAVYTSGKASSAAGLTATVVKDPDTGEFNIEAGALMLADNGICCIDEFDKMDPKDQVAIHEAMEQQTISIAKAGIHATLNARTSILAAANPIAGRYDKSRTLKANLNVTPAIMSRFDLFFVVLDECDENTDYKIAKHIVSIHQRQDQALRPVFNTRQLKNYIKYSRKLKPQITPESHKLLVENYRKLRSNDVVGHGKTAYRITVRQLESMIRLSEALARLNCSDKVLPEYVLEAALLLRKSIIHVETGDVIFEPDANAALLGTKKTTTKRRQEGKSDSESDTKKSKAKKKGSSEPTNAAPQPMTINFERYQQIVKMLTIHLNSLPNGETQADLVNWYINQNEDNITSENALEQETLLVNRIIQRLVTKERILFVAQESATGEAEDRVLAVNPNFEV